MMPRLPLEATNAREPALLEVAFALACAPNLAPVLADCCSTGGPAQPQGAAAAAPAAAPGGEAPPPVPCEEPWAKRGLGKKLLSSCVAVLQARAAHPACRSAVLDVVDALLEQRESLQRPILRPCTEQLLVALNGLVLAGQAGQAAPAPVAGGPGGAAAAAAAVAAAGRARRRGSHRELHILERVRAAGWLHTLAPARAGPEPPPPLACLHRGSRTPCAAPHRSQSAARAH
jgi:hypothetical protein